MANDRSIVLSTLRVHDVVGSVPEQTHTHKSKELCEGGDLGLRQNGEVCEWPHEDGNSIADFWQKRKELRCKNSRSFDSGDF